MQEERYLRSHAPHTVMSLTRKLLFGSFIVQLFVCCPAYGSPIAIRLLDAKADGENPGFFVSQSDVVHATFEAEPGEIVGYKILVNGEIIEQQKWPAVSRARISSNFVLRLRQFGNELRFIVSYSKGIERTDVCHVFVGSLSKDEPNRWVIVAAPDRPEAARLSDQTLPRANSRLISKILEDSMGAKVFTLLEGPDATASNIKGALFEVSRTMSANDQLFFYFSGTGYYEPTTHIPILLTADWNADSASHGGLELTELVSVLLSLRIPSVAVVLDTSFAPDQKSSPAQTYSWIPTNTPRVALDENSRDVIIKETTASWLFPLQHHPSLDFLMASQFYQPAFIDASGVGVFTKQFADNLLAIHSSSDSGSAHCKGLRDVWSRLSVSDSMKQSGQDPYYFSTSGDNPAFCLDNRSNASLGLQSTVNPIGNVQITGQYPRSANVDHMIVSANQTPVLARVLSASEMAQGVFSFQIPLSAGRTMVNVSLNNKDRSVLEDSIEVVYKGKLGVRDSLDADKRPIITIQQPPIYEENQDDSIIDVRGEESIDFHCIVHLREQKAATLEIRNNGVPLAREPYSQKHETSNSEWEFKIPLVIGRNNIEVEVLSGGALSHKRITINRRHSQHIVAILVGIDNYEDREIQPLSFAKADVDEVRRLLLSYTEILPSDIILLKDSKATKKSILQMFDAENLQEQLEEQGSKESLTSSSLFFYYAGYGGVLLDANGNVAARCMVPFDGGRSDLEKSCVKTDDIDRLIDNATWQNTVLILDTSYDGPTGHSGSTDLENQTARTLSTYHSQNPQWRLLAGVGKNRTFLVAGGTNEPALESSRLKHGVLTFALLDAFTRMSQDANPTQFSIADLYEQIQQRVSLLTGGAENPVLKGNLSQPIQFRSIDLAELRENWRRYLTKVKRDSVSLRKINPDDLNKSDGYLDKAKALFPDEPSVLTGQALVAKYFESIYCRARISDKCEYYRSQAREMLSKAATNENLRTVQSTEDRFNRYESQLALGVYGLEHGDFASAISNSKAAVATYPEGSLRAKYTMAKAYLASGDDIEAANVLDEILSSDRRSGGPSLLSAEEWGKAVIWRASLLRLEDRDIHAHQLLEEYARSDTAGATIATILATPIRWTVRPMKAQAPKPPKDIPSAWANEIANYLLGKRGDGDDLKTFIKYPDKDSDAIDCEAEYYIGLYSIWHSGSNAIEHFQNSVASGASDHLEYWLAKRRLDQASRSLNRPS
jgi:tetratricopeptide (TPR) repeat protein